MREIKTEYLCPPIPTRRFDWVAYRDGDEEEGLRGFGDSEQEAIDDLIDSEGDND